MFPTVILYLSFSDAGDLLVSFSKKGNGPGKNSSITDFIVESENIIVLNRALRRLLTYDFSGKFISNINLEFWAQAISPSVNNSYFLYCGNEYGDNERHKLRKFTNGKENFRQ